MKHLEEVLKYYGIGRPIYMDEKQKASVTKEVEEMILEYVQDSGKKKMDKERIIKDIFEFLVVRRKYPFVVKNEKKFIEKSNGNLKGAKEVGKLMRGIYFGFDLLYEPKTLPALRLKTETIEKWKKGGTLKEVFQKLDNEMTDEEKMQTMFNPSIESRIYSEKIKNELNLLDKKMLEDGILIHIRNDLLKSIDKWVEEIATKEV